MYYKLARYNKMRSPVREGSPQGEPSRERRQARFARFVGHRIDRLPPARLLYGDPSFLAVTPRRPMSTPKPPAEWPEHPRMSGFVCPSCHATEIRLATEAERFLYLRCDACAHVWSRPERRQRRRPKTSPIES
jgi:hypothetical protein